MAKCRHVAAVVLVCVLILAQTPAATTTLLGMLSAVVILFNALQSSPDTFHPPSELKQVHDATAGGGAVGGAVASIRAAGTLLLGVASAVVTQEKHVADFLYCGFCTCVYCSPGHMWIGLCGRWRYIGKFDDGRHQLRPIDVLFVWLSAPAPSLASHLCVGALALVLGFYALTG